MLLGSYNMCWDLIHGFQSLLCASVEFSRDSVGAAPCPLGKGHVPMHVSAPRGLYPHSHKCRVCIPPRRPSPPPLLPAQEVAKLHQVVEEAKLGHRERELELKNETRAAEQQVEYFRNRMDCKSNPAPPPPTLCPPTRLPYPSLV